MLGTRNDGFHEVEMILQSVELADQLSFQSSTDSRISLEIDPSSIADAILLPLDDNNLAVKAAHIIFNQFDINGGVVIRLKKNIPVAAGLAGGSTDAAAVLRGLNRLFKLNLSTDQLIELASEIGSDVPFCINGGTCLATGRGECLTPLPNLPSIPTVLINPRGAVPTAWAYKSYDNDPSPDHPNTLQLIEAVKLGDVKAVGELMFNVLERISVKLHPSITEYKQQLLDAGAFAAVMSGSGPTVFGLFNSVETANLFATSFNDTNANVFVTHTI